MKQRTLIAIFVLAASVALPRVAGATWVGTNCRDSHYDVSMWKRMDSRAYANVAVGEGYEWAGGCWNDNNTDNSPTDPDGDKTNNGAEGPDCSGLTFKSWKLMPTAGAAGGRHCDKLQNIHGPYQAWEYHSPGSSSWPFHTIVRDKQYIVYMDAYASGTHVGMIYTLGADPYGQDYIVEAVGTNPNGPPVGKYWRDYFGQYPTYVPVRREGWTPDCYPKCPASAATADGVDLGSIVVVP